MSGQRSGFGRRDFLRLLGVSAGAALLAPACADAAGGLRRVVLLYTNDEHGWMEGTGPRAGAARLMGLWKEREGYRRGGPCMVLSGGDMWTGPAVSSLGQGAPMAEVLNAMDYQAAALGNHDFDFGLEAVRARLRQSRFPFLSANMIERNTGRSPDFALPHVVREVNGVRLGLIGLTTIDTPYTAMPDTTAAYEFQPYDRALRRSAEALHAEGAEALVVLGHICGAEMRALAPLARQLGVAVIFGGHCHEEIEQIVEGVHLIQAGYYLRAYGRVEMWVDTDRRRVLAIESAVRPNRGGRADGAIAAVVRRVRAAADPALWEVIGYLRAPVDRRSAALANLITGAWLAAVPADVALTHARYYGTGLPAGPLDVAAVVGMLPMDYELVVAHLTGAQLLENVECCAPQAGGLREAEGRLWLADGMPVEPGRIYRVLTSEFLYTGGEGFRMRAYDPAAERTGVSWRQPVIDWIRARRSTRQSPLDDHLDSWPWRG